MAEIGSFKREIEVKLDARIRTPEIPIKDIVVGKRFREDLGDIGAFSESIKSVGLLHPIVVNEEMELIAGFRRLEACKRLGWQTIPVNVVPLRDLSKGEIQENTERKDFIVSEMVAIKRFYEPEISAEAEERMRTGKPSSKLDEGRTDEKIASYLGIGKTTLRKAEEIVEAAEADPETFGNILGAVDSGKTSIQHAYTEVKRQQKHENPPPLPEGVFDVIYADPPWQYYLPLRGAPDAHYQTMTLEDICSLEVDGIPIQEKIADDAILFLWATNPQLEGALEVARSWGFEYKTNMVWVKDKIGTGYYFRAKHELLLLATKGDIPPPVEANRPPSVLFSPREEHSKKPDEVYECIEVMYPNRRYLELFARNHRENWISWGLEI